MRFRRRRDGGWDTPDPCCDLCCGRGWVAVPDPFFGGATVDCRCPACCDLSVRARKSMWENNDGTKVGPK